MVDFEKSKRRLVSPQIPDRRVERTSERVKGGKVDEEKRGVNPERTSPVSASRIHHRLRNAPERVPRCKCMLRVERTCLSDSPSNHNIHRQARTRWLPKI
jgi:hypothetical protein